MSIEDIKTFAGILAEDAPRTYSLRAWVERILAKTTSRAYSLTKRATRTRTLKEKNRGRRKRKKKKKKRKKPDWPGKTFKKKMQPEEAEEEKGNFRGARRENGKETDAILYNDIASRVCEKLDAVYNEKTLTRRPPSLSSASKRSGGSLRTIT